MVGLGDRVWMQRAITEARHAEAHGDVPVGAIVVRGGHAVAAAHNRREVDADPTAHAELRAVREAARVVGSWRLDDCTLYVTLEPCTMCAGALVLARLPRLVYGARDPKGGAVGSLYDVPGDTRLNHRVDVTADVLADECGAVLARFFRARRADARAGRERPGEQSDRPGDGRAARAAGSPAAGSVVGRGGVA